MLTTEKWLEYKIQEYKKKPKETLQDMLTTVIDVSKQRNENRRSKAIKGLYDSCIKHTELFMKKIQ